MFEPGGAGERAERIRRNDEAPTADVDGLARLESIDVAVNRQRNSVVRRIG
jgi:hypothetical protein